MHGAYITQGTKNKTHPHKQFRMAKPNETITDLNPLIVENDGVDPDRGFAGGGVIKHGVERENPTRQPESAGAAGDRKLAVLVQNGVGAEDGEGAAVVGGAGEVEGEVVGENDVLQGSRRRQPLRVADVAGGGLRPHRQRVVPYDKQAEPRRRRGGACHVHAFDCGAGGGGAAQPVEVEVDFGYLFLFMS